MSSRVIAFTSITSNYIPKARVLAGSIKKIAPSVQFHLVLADDLPVGFDLDQEPFDSVIYAESLPIPNKTGWLFSHTVVELCTAVKGIAAEKIFEDLAADKVFYFDPDVVVFSRLDELCKKLDEYSVLLTPHLTDPETSVAGINDNEMAALIHGVFNLGFVGIRNDKEGRRFSRWWTDRLLFFCHDDIPRGLFTDQKWVNLAPCFFDRVHVLRSPAFNVATWNISKRKATGSVAGGVYVNGEPLGFYHFSGLDSGAQELMLHKYGGDSPVLFDLRDWYIRACEAAGQSVLGKIPYKFAFFDDGSPVGRDHRVLYRQREDLQKAYRNPFSTVGDGGYKAWYGQNAPSVQESYRVLSIRPCAGLTDVLTDLATYFRVVAYSERARHPLKRFSLRLGAVGLGWVVRIVRWARWNR